MANKKVDAVKKVKTGEKQATGERASQTAPIR